MAKPPPLSEMQTLSAKLQKQYLSGDPLEALQSGSDGGIPDYLRNDGAGSTGRSTPDTKPSTPDAAAMRAAKTATPPPRSPGARMARPSGRVVTLSPSQHAGQQGGQFAGAGLGASRANKFRREVMASRASEAGD